MKKVLIVNTVNFRLGGISAVIVNYYKHINKNELKMDIVVNGLLEATYENLFKENNSVVYRLNRKKNPIKYFFEIYRIIKKEKYDVIHVHGNSATMTVELLAAKLAGCPVRIAHSHNTECTHLFVHKMLSPLFKLTYTKALACSREAGNWIFGEHKFDILPNGIKVEKFKFSEIIRKQVRNELGMEDKVIIGHVGFMNEQKNHPKLFEIFAEIKKKIPNAHLLCVTGDSEVPEELNCLMKKLKINNDVTVLFKRNDVNRLLQAMDIFVFPSKWEGFGIVLVEAQTSGLPCMVSNKVPSIVNITGEVSYLELSLAEYVIEKINNETTRENKYEILKQSDYNIRNNVDLLLNLY